MVVPTAGATPDTGSSAVQMPSAHGWGWHLLAGRDQGQDRLAPQLRAALGRHSTAGQWVHSTGDHWDLLWGPHRLHVQVL